MECYANLISRRRQRQTKCTRTKEEDCEAQWWHVAVLKLRVNLRPAYRNIIYHGQLHTKNQSTVNQVNFRFHTLSTSSPKVITMS